MKIYVEESFKLLKMQLKDKGYEVEDENLSYDCDVVICDIKNGDLKKIVTDSSFRKEGILIIDKGGKSVNDIEKLIDNRILICLT